MMKKILSALSLLFVIVQSYAQTTTENYIQSRSYLEPVTSSSTTAKQVRTVQYFDGLGRLKQLVNVKASPLGKDVVTHVEYDPFGRQVKDFLPIPQSGTQNGAIIPTPLANAPAVYGSEKIYAEKVLENSPLDRIQQQIQVGNDWTNKPVAFQYGTNAQNEVYKFTTNTTWVNNATSSALVLEYFPANQLYKNTVTDEDGNTIVEYKNGQGQIVLVSKEGTNTYYVYNEYNQLAFVIPPKALTGPITEAVLNDLCYQYRYDRRGRLVEKKLPGKGWEYMVYNNADQLVMSQDANLRAQNKWMLTKYDQFERVVLTGITNNTATRQTLQANITAATYTFEIRSVGSFTVSGMPIYYTNRALPASLAQVLTINYYDSYPGYGFNPTFPTTLIGGEVPLSDDPSTDGRSTKGLPVMNLVKNIDDDNWTRNYTYYDKKGRVIGTHSINHLGGYTRSETQLDFAGAPQKTLTFQVRKGGESGVTVNERFVYDNQNRLLQHYHQVDDKPEQLLAENTYNEISQLTNKKVGNNLQSIDYAYNIRGWMTDINKDQMAVPNLGGKLFSYKIKYTQKEGIENPDPAQFGGKNVKARYNGNIAEVDWRAVETLGVNPSSTPKRYGYAYDNLNRLSAGYYQNPNNPYSKENTESLAYDLNGNITSLYRTSVIGGNTTATVIDNLQYTYQGNRLTQLDDASGNPSGYEAASSFSTAINYDANGNMINMPGKGIMEIQYNCLNLPKQVDLDQGGSPFISSYIYGADGTKMKKTTVSTVSGYQTSTTTTEETDYLDGFQYLHKETVSSGGGGNPGEMYPMAPSERAMEMEAYSVQPENTATISLKTQDLQFFPTAEGFYDYTKDQYIYSYKDHLGNARVSFGRTSAGALEIVDSNDYYPFGMNHLKTGNAYFGAGSYKAYKFQEQELQETGFYSFKWRQYMPDVARFFNIDPLAEKYPTWAPYVFSGNRVVDARELEGLEPHVLFNTRENAAANFGQQYNGKSILNKQEIGALIYFKYVDGKKYYAYNNPTTGDAHGIPQGLNMKLPKGAAASAYIHAHGNEDKEYDDENFSGDPSGGGDKGVANDLGLDGFLVTPGGLLKYYDLSSNTEKILRTNMPSDPNSPERKNKNNPVENPNPSSGDYRSKPFPNLKPIPDDRPKPIIDGGFKSIENNKKNHQPPLIDLSHLPYHR